MNRLHRFDRSFREFPAEFSNLSTHWSRPRQPRFRRRLQNRFRRHGKGPRRGQGPHLAQRAGDGRRHQRARHPPLERVWALLSERSESRALPQACRKTGSPTPPLSPTHRQSGPPRAKPCNGEFWRAQTSQTPPETDHGAGHDHAPAGRRERQTGLGRIRRLNDLFSSLGRAFRRHPVGASPHR